jgi:gamma-glutamyltranspeptidase/glutathione hydrolase
MTVGSALARAAAVQRERLVRGGAGSWPITSAVEGQHVRQPELAAVLAELGARGRAAFYDGVTGAAVAAAARRDGGSLSPDDLAAHRSVVGPPLRTAWSSGTAWVQPPPAQGVLLAMALRWWEEQAAAGRPVEPEDVDHVAVELTAAVFGHRDRCIAEGAALLERPLEVDRARASRRGGPRPYLHTTGVAVADADGTVVSSLVSVFDDFGSCTFVPEGGFVLNDRAGGFTEPPNDHGPSRRPVHTLAPVLLERDGVVTALATPGADGQVQTLLQVLCRLRSGAALVERACRVHRAGADGSGRPASSSAATPPPRGSPLGPRAVGLVTATTGLGLRRGGDGHGRTGRSSATGGATSRRRLRDEPGWTDHLLQGVDDAARSGVRPVCGRLVAAPSVTRRVTRARGRGCRRSELATHGLPGGASWAADPAMPSVVAELDSGRPGPHLVLNVTSTPWSPAT